MVECCVYWVRAKEHTDIFTEGYVGITNNFDYRMSQHISNCTNPKHYKTYRTAFRECVNSEDYVATKVIIASREYCLEVEGKLRPSWAIGWNIAKGGNGGYGKHGLTGSKMAKTFYNMMTRAGVEGEDVCPEWLAVDGLESFKIFYDSISEQDGEFTLKVRGQGYHPSNVVKLSRSEICRRSRSTYDIGDGGQFYSVEALAEKYNIKPNTISSRMRDGWSVREAIGLDVRTENIVCLSSGICAEYKGKWSIEDLEWMRESYENGVTLTEIERQIGIDSSNFLRFAKMFRFKKNNRSIKLIDFMGECLELNLKSKLNENLIESFKEAVLSGKSAKEVSQLLCIPLRSVYHLKKILRWKEYERTMEDSKLTLEG